MKDGVLTVYPQTDAEFLQFSDPETETQIMRAFGANNIALSFKAEKRDAGPDMDSEIDRIKKMLAGGKAKLNITR